MICCALFAPSNGSQMSLSSKYNIFIKFYMAKDKFLEYLNLIHT